MSYKSYQVRKKGIGLVEMKQVILHEEGKMDDGITFSRSQGRNSIEDSTDISVHRSRLKGRAPGCVNAAGKLRQKQ